MDAGTKRALLARVRRVEGQARAISRMLDEERDCVDVLVQISAAQGALGKIGEVLLGSRPIRCARPGRVFSPVFPNPMRRISVSPKGRFSRSAVSPCPDLSRVWSVVNCAL